MSVLPADLSPGMSEQGKNIVIVRSCFGQTPDRNNDDAAPHRERENTTSASRTRFYKFGCGLKQESPAMAGLLRTKLSSALYVERRAAAAGAFDIGIFELEARTFERLDVIHDRTLQVHE